MTPSEWRGAGAALAPLDLVTVLLICGERAEPLAAVARGAADAADPGRRVAIFDLAGAFGLNDLDGLVQAFNEGRSLNALARQLGDDAPDHFLVPRGPGRIPMALASHERWPRLIEGFRTTGALLIITLGANLPGAAEFAQLADRAVALDEAGEVATLSAFGEPAPVAAPLRSRATAESLRNPASRNWRWLAAGVVLAAGVGGWTLFGDRIHAALAHAQGQAQAEPAPARTATAQGAAADPVAMALPQVVNPNDSSRAAAWCVELVATNDRTDANFRLAEHGALPAGTVSPVLLGGDPAPWFRVVAGAFVDRTAAELLRATLRRVGMLDGSAGLVSRMPYALRLDTGLTPAIATARATRYVRRGIAAYTLQDEAGHVTIYAGAFASPEQTVVLIAELRAAGLTPDLAFRVGRTY